MEHFLSCDWGTTSFRLRLADTAQGNILMEEKSSQGIADTFNLWQETGSHDQEKRISFYLAIIDQHIKKLEAITSHSLAGAKLIISGMASSTIGLMDIPYKSIPLAIDGSDIKTAFIPAAKDFLHDVLIISGVRTNDDVMRGEETQLIGCIDPSYYPVKNELYIFPGTHSKHIQVKDNQVVGIKTYMTGEFFDLLSQKSILKNSVESGEIDDVDLDAFKKGVNDAVTSNLLHTLFRVRTNHLFNTATKKENFDYLSGLLIGTELQDLKTANAAIVNLLCGSNLEVYYRIALQELGVSKTINTFPAQWVEEAAVRGHYKIGRQLKMF